MTNLTLYQGEGTKLALKGAKNMAAALRQSSQTGTSGGELPEGGVYISFSGKMGAYSIGPDKEAADPEELWLVNVFEFQDGWMCWKGNQPVAKRFASAFGTPVSEPDFKEHAPFKDGEGWAPAKGMMVRSIDRGMQGYYSTSTKSAVKEMSKLITEIARRLEEGLPAWPIIRLHKDKFTAQGKVNFKPVFDVAGWLAMQQVQKMAAMESNEDVVAAIEDLVEEAEKMEAEGVLDSTMHSGGDAADDSVDNSEGGIEDDRDISEIEDADIVDEEEGDDEPEHDSESQAEIERQAEAAEAARKAAAQKSGGLRRTLRKPAA